MWQEVADVVLALACLLVASSFGGYVLGMARARSFIHQMEREQKVCLLINDKGVWRRIR